jgi:hypothetical protein
VRAWIVRGRRHAPAATVRWPAGVTVAGSVADSSGRSDGGEIVSLVSAGRAIAIARTRPDGRFAVRLGSGPSRRLVATAQGARSRVLELSVRVAVRLAVSRHRRWTALVGALRGGHVPERGVLVTIQGLRAHRWVALTTVRTTAAGRFHARVPAGTAARLRAAVPAQPGYPFAPGASSAR